MEATPRAWGFELSGGRNRAGLRLAGERATELLGQPDHRRIPARSSGQPRPHAPRDYCHLRGSLPATAAPSVGCAGHAPHPFTKRCSSSTAVAQSTQQPVILIDQRPHFRRKPFIRNRSSDSGGRLAYRIRRAIQRFELPCGCKSDDPPRESAATVRWESTCKCDAALGIAG